MNEQKISPDCKQALARAVFTAQMFGHDKITGLHILHGLIEDEGSLIAIAIAVIMHRQGSELIDLHGIVSDELETFPLIKRNSAVHIPDSDEVVRIRDYAKVKAAIEGTVFVDSLHLISAIFYEKGAAVKILESQRISEDEIREYVESLTNISAH